MDTERWKILLTAIDKGSLCAAGEALDYTVSGISRSVAALEKEIGFPLLYRSKQGVTPTPACEQLLPCVRELLFAQEKSNRQQPVSLVMSREPLESAQPSICFPAALRNKPLGAGEMQKRYDRLYAVFMTGVGSSRLR